MSNFVLFFFFQAEDGIRDGHVTGVQTCALPISGDLKARGDRIVAAYEQSIVKPIERLKAPPEIADQAAELRRIARQQLNALGALATAGKAGDVARVQRLATINQQLNRQAAQIARALKADSC